MNPSTKVDKTELTQLKVQMELEAHEKECFLRNDMIVARLDRLVGDIEQVNKRLDRQEDTLVRRIVRLENVLWRIMMPSVFGIVGLMMTLIFKIGI